MGQPSASRSVVTDHFARSGMKPEHREKHMARLARFTLDFDKLHGQWALRHDGSAAIVKRFPRKADAVAGGVLGRAVGKGGGSVRIKGKNGRIQEERTYPRGADPRRSKG